MRRWFMPVALLVLGLGCGSSTSSGPATPGPSCSADTDNVSVRSALIAIASVPASPSVCQVVMGGTAISASNGGTADARFGSDGLCSFYQLQPAAAGAAVKTADYTTRPVGGGLFHMDNGAADCTLATGSPLQLCGQETLFPDGTSVGVHVDCNNDPVLDVAVYRGSVRVTLNALSPPQQFHVSAKQALKADPLKGGGSIATAQFSPQQMSLFDTQLDLLLTKSSSTDSRSLLKAGSLTPSENVVAPNALKTFLGNNYGVVKPMCGLAPVPVVFYPTNPYASTPVLYGGLCAGRSARIYGLAIYLPTNLTYGSGQFFSEAGGVLVKNTIFANPLTIEPFASAQLFTWKGDLGLVAPAAGAGSPSPSAQASKNLYVVKFLYDVPPDTTPRIGLVAVSYGGASWPPIIS